MIPRPALKRSGVSKSKRRVPHSIPLPLAPTPKRDLAIHHDNPGRRRIVWRFGQLDSEWPEGAKGLGVKDFRLLHEKLGQYETQTVNEVWAPGAGCHKYVVGNLPILTYRRLEQLERDDADELHSLVLKGSFRVVGILREHIYYILWIDPKHEVFPSKLKHT
jgi:hypothetical protein